VKQRGSAANRHHTPRPLLVELGSDLDRGYTHLTEALSLFRHADPWRHLRRPQSGKTVRASRLGCYVWRRSRTSIGFAFARQSHRLHVPQHLGYVAAADRPSLLSVVAALADTTSQTPIPLPTQGARIRVQYPTHTPQPLPAGSRHAESHRRPPPRARRPHPCHAPSGDRTACSRRTHRPISHAGQHEPVDQPHPDSRPRPARPLPCTSEALGLRDRRARHGHPAQEPSGQAQQRSSLPGTARPFGTERPPLDSTQVDYNGKKASFGYDRWVDRGTWIQHRPGRTPKSELNLELLDKRVSHVIPVL
jgi:hypothetical protein